ncbi:GspE/PulE family protein [Desulfoplanes formicivorans]|uniref:Secretion system protein E n=1 Tax=Desulfoplanes formicivorans TaxID=1592317 RepID=A0A194AHU1_9BACT|nr:GspE/PulE family protein [Desulfoplanes formicivorans]GAU08790.1 secretion system protein E [Desulfoplanes formicivorans]
MTAKIWPRHTYSLSFLLPVLGQQGELNREQTSLVVRKAREHGIGRDDPQGLDFLIRLGLTRARAMASGPDRRLDEESILRAVAQDAGLEYKRIDPLEIDLEVSAGLVSESFARRNLLVPLYIQDGVLCVAVHNPFCPELWEDVARVTTLPHRVFLTSREQITRLIEDVFQFRLSVRAAEREIEGQAGLGDQEARVSIAGRLDPTSQHHLVKAVDYLLATALVERASDIHFEPKRDHSLVRFRIDGILHPVHRLPTSVHQAMLNRLKGMSRLDISEKRRPQDGRVQLVLEGTPTDVRVSTIPVAFGEKMVLRLLSGESILKPLDALGMGPEQLGAYQSLIRRTHGLILVTGPTGSGKSTTLYSTLKVMAHSGINVVTIEDPIEMIVEDFNQIGIQDRIGVGFGKMLRHILRQDPDIVMVGEMRDLDTAEEAIQAALTGHLVLSTLHTNDAASTLTRLRDLGVESYLLNASLLGVIAQRLVRTICPHCRVPSHPRQADLDGWGLGELFTPEDTLYRGVGCEYCRNTGYLGREGLFEVVPLDAGLGQGLDAGMDVEGLRRSIRTRGIKSLFQDGMEKVRAGKTTIEEVLRVTGGATSRG